MLAREDGWPFLPEIHLFHSKSHCERFIRERMQAEPQFFDGVGAQTWHRGGVAVVLMSHGDEDDLTEESLLVHEAVHVVLLHFECLGEDDFGQEFLAYGVQTVSAALIRAHRKWKRHKKRAKKAQNS